MKRRPSRRSTADPFDRVKRIGLSLPGAVVETRYDGSPVLKMAGSFFAGLASHRSAEPGTLVVRSGLEERHWLIEEAPETYYLTDYYRKYPLVLARLACLDGDALRDLLSVSHRLTLEKSARSGAVIGGRAIRPWHRDVE